MDGYVWSKLLLLSKISRTIIEDDDSLVSMITTSKTMAKTMILMLTMMTS